MLRYLLGIFILFVIELFGEYLTLSEENSEEIEIAFTKGFWTGITGCILLLIFYILT